MTASMRLERNGISRLPDVVGGFLQLGATTVLSCIRTHESSSLLPTRGAIEPMSR